jgi:hypothetical protein
MAGVGPLLGTALRALEMAEAELPDAVDRWAVGGAEAGITTLGTDCSLDTERLHGPRCGDEGGQDEGEGQGAKQDLHERSPRFSGPRDAGHLYLNKCYLMEFASRPSGSLLVAALRGGSGEP